MKHKVVWQHILMSIKASDEENCDALIVIKCKSKWDSMVTHYKRYVTKGNEDLELFYTKRLGELVGMSHKITIPYFIYPRLLDHQQASNYRNPVVVLPQCLQQPTPRHLTRTTTTFPAISNSLLLK